MLNKIDYPNPQMIRTNWLDLNGNWAFFIAKNESDSTNHPSNFPDQINVPYSYTFKKAHVNEKEYFPVVWYQKYFDLSLKKDHRYLLHFEAVDYQCQLWLNDHFIGSHTGGHTPFTIDISKWVTATNKLEIRVEDVNATDQPIGKQSWKDHNFLCWYTRTIGIWQNVWLEETGEEYLEKITMIPDIHQSQLNIDAKLNLPAKATIRAAISFHGQVIKVASCSTTNGRARFAVDVSNDDPNFRLHYWSPNEPNLYDVSFEVIKDNSITDTVNSYFGMRQVETRNQAVYLNDQSLYQKLILNQGYYPDAGLTGSVNDYKADLTKLKAMGFNGNRIHQHVESHRMLYLCDKLGVLAWAEFPSSFSFSPAMMRHTLAELPDFIAKHINHPSVIAYVLMNESWGVNEIAHNHREQSFADSLYYLTKGFDDSRLVIANDGWEQVKTDLCTIHDYNGDPQSLAASYQNLEQIFTGNPSLTSGRRVFCDGYERQNVPFLISEYGGIAYEENAQQQSWGYGKRIQSKEAVVDKIGQLTQAVMSIPHCAGFCYTQLTDVEQEVNGLLDHDHQYKFDPTAIHQIMTATHQTGFDFD
ncbi:MAG: hypothetical protein LKJ51_04990 [Limosilactobacillus sp.]|uniref:glycoside hydrolase family 2 protein n=1 Tax=Limosilactobacillus sp. TaxID=2773925 RepID=UPI0025BF8FC2|nr:sugar-binding domain-containing protein [Limosilactobacillus sp.]MCI1975255.1 hypothetical protein [Limosilactobacillus sp.]MCI2030708.1 hypothetical protein [Limosilactobacillus sp.]